MMMTMIIIIIIIIIITIIIVIIVIIIIIIISIICFSLVYISAGCGSIKWGAYYRNFTEWIKSKKLFLTNAGQKCLPILGPKI